MSWMTRCFPPRCLLCSDSGDAGRALCRGCTDDLPRIEAACSRCGEVLPVTAPGQPDLTVCGACLWHPPPYSAIAVPWRYAAPVDWLVQRLKFHRDLAAGRLLGDLLAAHLRQSMPLPDAIVPVPLHMHRLNHRGYNQVAELARPIAHVLGVPLRIDGLQRRHAAAPQMDLPARQRRANVRGAFEPGCQRIPKRILLLDDVVTTASTVCEASRALLQAGATDVRVAAVARA